MTAAGAAGVDAAGTAVAGGAGRAGVAASGGGASSSPSPCTLTSQGSHLTGHPPGLIDLEHFRQMGLRHSVVMSRPCRAWQWRVQCGPTSWL